VTSGLLLEQAVVLNVYTSAVSVQRISPINWPGLYLLALDTPYAASSTNPLPSRTTRGRRYVMKIQSRGWEKWRPNKQRRYDRRAHVLTCIDALSGGNSTVLLLSIVRA